MALTPTPRPPFPSVPNAPGVPPLNRIGNVIAPVVLAFAALSRILRFFTGPEWGIFSEKGSPLLIGNSVVGVEYKGEARVSDYPIEKGSFATYNKVLTPFDARATFTVGGSDNARAAFLAMCEKLMISTTLVVLVSPEVVYQNCTVTHYDYRRTSKNGVSLLTVDVWLIEVREAKAGAFGQASPPTTPGQTLPAPSATPTTATPSGASPASTGAAQPVPATAGQEVQAQFGGLY